MNSMRISALIWLVCVGLCWGCSRSADQKTAGAPEKGAADKVAVDETPAVKVMPNEVAAADLAMNPEILFEFAVYLPETNADPLDVVDRLLKDKFTKFQRVEKIEPKVKGLVLAAKVMNDAQQDYKPPDREWLENFGHGLTSEQIEALQKATQVVVLDFAYAKEHAWDGMQAALEFADTLARETDGLLWDEHTAEVFTPQAWEERRLADWSEGIPDVAFQTSVHSYSKGQYMRAITKGMIKFGLPDVVVDEFSASMSHDLEQIASLFAQALAEGGEIDRPGQFDLNVKAIKNVKLREAQLSSLGKNGTGVALLSLHHGKWEEGDPENRLVEIAFDRYEGSDVHARQQKMVSAMFGSESSVVDVEHDEELRAASHRAVEKLPALRIALNAGLAPMEWIKVKALFETAKGNHELMWVEVTNWRSNEIEGHLRNEPRDIPDLHAGQIVHIDQSQVFDYLHKLPDGSVEGDETGEMIEKKGK